MDSVITHHHVYVIFYLNILFLKILFQAGACFCDTKANRSLASYFEKKFKGEYIKNRDSLTTGEMLADAG